MCSNKSVNETNRKKNDGKRILFWSRLNYDLPTKCIEWKVRIELKIIRLNWIQQMSLYGFNIGRITSTIEFEFDIEIDHTMIPLNPVITGLPTQCKYFSFYTAKKLFQLPINQSNLWLEFMCCYHNWLT